MLPELITALRGPQLLLFVGISLALYLIASYLAAWHRLRHFPGPTLGSFSYLWMFRAGRSGRQSERYNLNKRYNSNLVRIGPNDLITDDPDIIRRMNGARSTYGRSSWYAAMKMDPYGDCLFDLTDTAAHDRLKARLAFGYGGKENPHLERDIDEQVLSYVDLIRRTYLSSDGVLRPLDFAHTISYFTLDAITKIAYGAPFGYLATDSDVYGYLRGIEASVPILTVLAEIPALCRVAFSPWVLRLFGPRKTDAGGMGKMLAVAEQTVAERFGPHAKDGQDMLGAFVRHGITQRQCEIEVPFQIIAGADTTATAIRATMLYLATCRGAYDKLQREIDTAAAEGRISSPVITAAEGKGLTYLQAVIYEGLRMQVPFSGLVMKRVPAGGDTIDGRFVPGGTRIAHNTLGIQRNAAVFGEDVDVFRPERWMDADPARRTLMVQTTEMVFGHGRWGCLGKPVAFVELNKIYVELLRRFDFQIINAKRPWREHNANLFFQSEMWMRVTERFPEGVQG
ncbi:cytochrome P450 [Podospora appendiculata]|uniref:Cytochrome P450 monooxygenase ABA1 n=1 Tax=Podospora appendiculata TaxID=314037 RepID=A0AAE0X212_9PEZI|nr:cytochrome P450 [Podospora appendiculata]